jgi:hypothetical protein
MDEIRSIITGYVTNQHISADKMIKILHDEFGIMVTKKTVLRIYKELGELKQKRPVYHKQQLGTTATNEYNTITKREQTENSYSIDPATGEYNGIISNRTKHVFNRSDITDLELLYLEYVSCKTFHCKIEIIREIFNELNKMNIDENLKDREIKIWKKRLLAEWEFFNS